MFFSSRWLITFILATSILARTSLQSTSTTTETAVTGTSNTDGNSASPTSTPGDVTKATSDAIGDPTTNSDATSQPTPSPTTISTAATKQSKRTTGTNELSTNNGGGTSVTQTPSSSNGGVTSVNQTTSSNNGGVTSVTQTPSSNNGGGTPVTPTSASSNTDTAASKSTTADPHLGNNTGGHYDDEEEVHGSNGVTLIPFNFHHVKSPMIITLVVILAGMSKLAFHFSHFLSSKVPESCVLIVLGIVFGIIFYFSGLSEHIELYEPHEFFLYLLPPIILEAAFSLHDRTFAENLGSVLLFAVLGTVLNFFIIGLSLYGLYQAGAMEEINCSFIQLLVFSALIVAVDPVAVLAVFQEVGVNSTLYYLVFGESLLNDGVTVVLYNVMQILNTASDISAGQIFLGIVKFFVVVLFGVMIGVICGLVSSFITKYTNSVKVVEPLIVFGFAYLSFILSEMFEFSGIISIIVCGILQVHYAFHNITNKSRLAVKFFAKVMASTNEIIIFMFLGLVTVNPNHDWKTGFTLWAMLLCILTRFLVTFGMSMLINKFSTGVRKIKHDEMFMISYGGLRGAVCFSLVALIKEKEIPMKNMFVTTTLFVIFFTVFIQGGTIKWLVKKLRVSLAEQKEDMQLNEELATHVFDHIMAGIEEVVGYKHGTHHVKMKLDHIDDAIIRPRLLRHATNSELEDISHYYEKLVMKEHYKNLQLSGAKLRHVKTEIRHLDSELALNQLDHDSDEREVHERRDDRLSERDQKHMERNKSFGDSLHRFFSHTMHSVRSQLHLQVHDRNLVHDKKHNLVAHLKRKHRRNKQLSKMAARDSAGGVGSGDGNVHLPGTEDNLTIMNEELKKSRELGLDIDRKPSQVRFTIEEDDEKSEDSNGTADGKVVFRL